MAASKPSRPSSTTAPVTAFLNRNLTEQILGKDLDACQELVQETYDREIVRENIQEEILLRRVIVNGNATHDDYDPDGGQHRPQRARRRGRQSRSAA